MTRAILIAVVVLIALDIYALADVFMTARERFRSLNRVAWAAIVLLFTPIGAILWLTMGKAHRNRSGEIFRAPDDDPNFRVPETESPDERIARLEEELRKLDEEGDNPPGLTRD
ncbi:MAG: hypothetical protein RLZZ40_1022 [Actinomycetota bacterium]|jgi:hypothetical protein